MFSTVANTIIIVLVLYLCICIIYFFIQEKFIFVPTLPGEPFESKLATFSEEFFIETPNQGHIHALLLKVTEPKGLIFYLHGNTGSLKRWQFMAEELSGYGYDVFVLDYRGYGQSRGRKSEGKMHRDVEFCFDFILEKYHGQKIVIYGRSLGCAFATKLAARRLTDLVVLETPFFNMTEVGKHYLPFLPVVFLLRYRFRSDIYVQQIIQPVHIFHGTKDIIVPHSQALALYKLADQHNRQIKMTTIVGGKHGNLNSFPLFRERLEEFLS